VTQAPLDPEHRRWLVEESAISPEIIERAGLYSEYDAKAAAKLLGRAAQHWDGHLPVLVIPYRLPGQRDPVRYRGKPLTPFEVRKNDGSVAYAKYVEPKGSPVHIYFTPPLLDPAIARDVSIDLFVTEGERKALSAASKGLACLAISGVTQWHEKGSKQLHPGFAFVALRGRKVRLALDRDSLTNKQVRDQEIALGRALEAEGAIVTIVRFPEDAPKFDDFLARHEFSELAELLADADQHGQLPPDTRNVSEDWKAVVAKLRCDSDTGLPFKDGDNVATVLMTHPAWSGVLAFDARRERQLFLRAPPFAADMAVAQAPIPRAVIDTDTTRIAFWLVAQSALGWTLAPQQSQLEHAISVVCERNRFDGVQDYLRALAWDGTPRLDVMGSAYFGVADSAYARAVFSKWMLSAVARARTPGCQVDHVLVLEGPQGAGKSTALRILAGSDYFSDTLPELGRDAHEYCIGPWIIELAELDHMRKSEVTAIKAFISARAPSFRGAYARRTVEHPRRCVFAATTNDSGYLADSTGNRRFWPVACTTLDLEALARDRDQLWAEAVHRLRAGESWHITDPEVRVEAEEQQAARREVDPWHMQVVQFIRKRKAVTVGDVLDHLGHGPEDAPQGFTSRERGRKGWQYDQRSANRVAAILREVGWVRRMVRVDGYRVWQYVQDLPEVVSGDRGVTGKLYEIKAKSPPSPPSPLDPLYTTHASVRDAGAHPSAPAGTPAPALFSDLSSQLLPSLNSSDSSDSGEKLEDSDSCSVASKSPLPNGNGDSTGKRKTW
jgi:hypothetical protein